MRTLRFVSSRTLGLEKEGRRRKGTSRRKVGRRKGLEESEGGSGETGEEDGNEEAASRTVSVSWSPWGRLSLHESDLQRKKKARTKEKTRYERQRQLQWRNPSSSEGEWREDASRADGRVKLFGLLDEWLHTLLMRAWSLGFSSAC
jgi:hypothetical protein